MSEEKIIKRVLKAEPFVTFAYCGKCGGKLQMDKIEFDGVEDGSFYKHLCVKCGEEYSLKNQYPLSSHTCTPPDEVETETIEYSGGFKDE